MATITGVDTAEVSLAPARSGVGVATTLFNVEAFLECGLGDLDNIRDAVRLCFGSYAGQGASGERALAAVDTPETAIH